VNSTKRYVAPGIRDHYVVSKRRTAIIHWRGATSKKNGNLKVTVVQLTKMTKKEKDMTIKHENEYESVTAQQLLYYDPPQKYKFLYFHVRLQNCEMDY
jgi:hypothetical protein